MHTYRFALSLINSNQLNFWLIKWNWFQNLPIVKTYFSWTVSDKQHRVIMIPDYRINCDIFRESNLFVKFPHFSIVKAYLIIIIWSSQNTTISVVKLTIQNLLLCIAFCVSRVLLAHIPNSKSLVRTNWSENIFHIWCWCCTNHIYCSCMCPKFSDSSFEISFSIIAYNWVFGTS